MPTASRNVRKQRRLKHKLTQTKNFSTQTMREYQRTFVTLLYLLAQQGGEATVTQGTMLQVMQQAQHLTFKVANTDVEGEVRISLVDMRKAPTTPVTDDPAAAESTL